MDQSDHIIKACSNYLKDRTPPKCDMTFRIDPQAEDDNANIVPCSGECLKKFERQHSVSFRTLNGETQHVTTQSSPDLACATHRNGAF